MSHEMTDMSRDKSHSARDIDVQPATIDVSGEEVGKLEKTPSHSLPAVTLAGAGSTRPAQASFGPRSAEDGMDAPAFVDVDDIAMQVDRDPNRWHDTVRVKFDDIFGEPDPEVFSIDSVWSLANKVYSQSKYWCYRGTSLVLAVPLAALCGLQFACLVFCRVWCCVPCLRVCDIEMQCIRRCCEVSSRSLLAPVYEAVGRVFSQIRVRWWRGNDGLNV